MSSAIPPVAVDAAEFLAKLAYELAVPSEIDDLRSSIHFDGHLPILPIPHKSVSSVIFNNALFLD